MFTEEQRNDAIALVDEFVAAQVEYEESHCDAGDAYAHMPREGGFDYMDGEKRLAAWCAEHDIQGNPDALADIALDNFTMQPGTIYHPTDVFVVDSYPLQEIEIDLNHLVESGAISWELLMDVADDCDAYVTGTGHAYWGTDCAWYAVISPDDMADATLATIGEQVTCEMCERWTCAAEVIHTEDGHVVGECCHDQLRAVHCDKQGETWYYAE